MSLGTHAFLEIPETTLETASDDGVFEFEVELDVTGEVDKDHLLGDRGQYISELFDIATDLGDSDLDFDFGDEDPGPGNRRQGYRVDGGAGRKTETLSFESDFEAQWGDGSGSPVSMTDATDSTDPMAHKQILEYWVGQSRTDSLHPAWLHLGEWCDTTYADSAGVYGEPMAVSVDSATVSRDANNPSAIEGTLEIARIQTLPGVVDDIDDALGYILDR